MVLFHEFPDIFQKDQLYCHLLYCFSFNLIKNIVEKSEVISQQTEETTQNDNEGSFEERLTKLKSLFDKELITKEEYDKKRKEILDQM